jgi:hypothetical protein
MKAEQREMFRFPKMRRTLMATLTAVAAAMVWVPAFPAHAQGPRNCVEATNSEAACYELVWVEGFQLTMTFSTDEFTGSTPTDKVGNFYVLAPQTDAPQGTLPFPHDHVVAQVPAHNHGSYKVHLHGYFVLCSAEGIASGSCEPTMTTIMGLGTMPFAKTVDGQPLTSVESIESAVAAGLLSLFDTGGDLVGTLGSGR